MTLANKTQIDRYTGKVAFPSGKFIDIAAARINEYLIAQTSGKMPCYAARIGPRGAIVWVSVGSSCRIARSEANRMIAGYGGNLEALEALKNFHKKG